MTTANGSHANGNGIIDEWVAESLRSPRAIPRDAKLGNIYEPPPLPTYAQLTPRQIELADNTGQFLKEYVDFAKKASPMTPTEFHESAALSAVAVAIARRLHIRVGAGKIYPNLYTLFVGESTLHRKSTGLSILTGLLDKAEMIPAFTLADRQTPEAFVEDMSLSIPASYDRWNDEVKANWLKRRPLRAQRGWFLDEASQLLDSFNRDYSSGMLPLILDVYDSKDYGAERNTKSYGAETIRNAYINVFGCTTHEAMTEHMSKSTHWKNGFFARFALVTSYEETEWQFWAQPVEYPIRLIEQLRFFAYGLFGGLPHVEIVSKQDKEGEPAYRNVEAMPLPENTAFLGEGAWQAWERYSKAVGHDLLKAAKQDGSVEKLLFANYGRFPTMMIKVAMLFAVMDSRQSSIAIEEKHIYAAQRIAEMWRANLHYVRSGGRISAGQIRIATIADALAKNGINWTTRRDLLRALNCAWSEIELPIKDMEVAGTIEIAAYQESRGPKGEKYRLLTPGEVSA